MVSECVPPAVAAWAPDAIFGGGTPNELHGRDAIADYPEWQPAHKKLLAAGIPTIVNVGGDFGAKASLIDVPVAYHLSKATGRPVKVLVMTRS